MNCLILGDIVSETELVKKYEKIQNKISRWCQLAISIDGLLMLVYFLYSLRFAFVYAKSIEVPLKELTLLLKNFDFLKVYRDNKDQSQIQSQI